LEQETQGATEGFEENDGRRAGRGLL